jgi:glutathione reductase (NADPH)
MVDGNRLAADFFIVATGARPSPLPFDGAEKLVTSSQFLALETLPSRIIFVGGGFISFEFAHFAARIGPGDRRIKILEAAGRPLGPFDGEMVDLLVKASAEAGIDVISGIRIMSVEKKGDVYRVITDSSKTFEADLVVHGASRVPWIENLNLEKTGIRTSAKGIRVNPQMQTTVRNIFAVGDCADTVALARVADFEAHAAAKNILAMRKDAAMVGVEYKAVPAVLFSYPQLGMVGETEGSLIKAGVSYRKSFDKGMRWPTYRRIGMQHAGYKILAGENGIILGAHILSDNVSGLIDIFRQAIIDGRRAEELYWQNIMTPYPSRESDIVYMLESLKT